MVKKKRSKGVTDLTSGSPCVFNYKNAIELWVMETKNWKQSYVCHMDFSSMGPTIFELWVMETELWVMKITHPNSPLATGGFFFFFFLWLWCVLLGGDNYFVWNFLKEIRFFVLGKIGWLDFFFFFFFLASLLEIFVIGLNFLAMYILFKILNL